MVKIGSRFMVQETECMGLLEWIGLRAGVTNWGKNPRALGVLDPDGGIIAGVGYCHYSGFDLTMHVAALARSRWLTRTTLFMFFDYPFNGLKCRRVDAFVEAKNYESRRLVEGLGYVQEGVARQAAPSGDDLVAYGMLKAECRWLNYRETVLKELGHEQIKAA